VALAAAASAAASLSAATAAVVVAAAVAGGGSGSRSGGGNSSGRESGSSGGSGRQQRRRRRWQRQRHVGGRGSGSGDVGGGGRGSCGSSHHGFIPNPLFPHTGESVQMKKNTEKFYFYLRHNKSNQANLDRVFSESRSGTIAHKNQKKIMAGSQYPEFPIMHNPSPII
jgi:hypothetical protein